MKHMKVVNRLKSAHGLVREYAKAIVGYCFAQNSAKYQWGLIAATLRFKNL
jgi:hypothetical protein